MTILRTLSCALGALLLTSVASAQAPTPAEIAQQCVQQIVQTTQNTAQAIQNRTQIGVARIVHLDEQGAPAPVIFAAAQASRHAINAAAHHGASTVNQTAAVCLFVLNQMDAPLAARQAVVNARQQALQTISGAREQGVFLIGQALMAAIGEPDATEAF